MPLPRAALGTFNILADSPDDVPKIAAAVDAMFHNFPEPTKTESEKAFQLSFINSLGNVKAFILSICFAVVFATLLVSANTMAMSIRERTREVAVLKTLGFTRQSILRLYVGEGVIVALAGGVLGCLLAARTGVGSGECTRHGILLAGDARDHPHFSAGHRRRRHGGISERDLACLPRGKIGYCGGLALRRVAKEKHGDSDQL